MLKSFPEQALSFAVGGVISPSALGQAALAVRVAAEEVTAPPEESRVEEA